jgi:hypothetical protein
MHVDFSRSGENNEAASAQLVREATMPDDADRSSGASADDALEGDLALDPEAAEQVTGGALLYCAPCMHHHSQRDPKCNAHCVQHGAVAAFGPAHSGY